jgi:hypothetical protein
MAITPVIEDLIDSISQLSDTQYAKKLTVLSNSSVGDHTRHIIELFNCLIYNYDSGIVNYENRKRDVKIASCKDIAIHSLQEILIRFEKKNKTLLLQTDATSLSDDIETNYFRELLFNLEHTIHHMALIRIGVAEISNINLSPNFGVAASTIKFQLNCAE